MATESPSLAGTHQTMTRSGRWQSFGITLLSLLLVIAAAGFSLGYWVQEWVQRSLQEEITRSLTQKAQLVANRINADRTHGIEVIASQEGQAAGARATVIDTNGQVVADSEGPLSSLQNEGRQPEFATALRGSTGTDLRQRNGAEVLFVAVPLAGGAVRLAYPMSDMDALMGQLRRRILWGCALCALAALPLSGILAWRIQPR